MHEYTGNPIRPKVSPALTLTALEREKTVPTFSAEVCRQEKNCRMKKQESPLLNRT